MFAHFNVLLSFQEKPSPNSANAGPTWSSEIAEGQPTVVYSGPGLGGQGTD